jgi:hypothetical protein
MINRRFGRDRPLNTQLFKAGSENARWLLAILGSGFSSQKSSCTGIAIGLAKHSFAGRGAVELSLWNKLN